jgi:hypothetical protein
MIAMWPCLHARNARALISFYEQAFGFTVNALIAGEGDRVDHAELVWPLGGGLMLASEKSPASDEPWKLQPGTFGAYLVCDEPAQLLKRAMEHGAVVIEPLATTHYGSIQFSVLDPEGNCWSFGTYLGQPSGEDS